MVWVLIWILTIGGIVLFGCLCSINEGYPALLFLSIILFIAWWVIPSAQEYPTNKAQEEIEIVDLLRSADYVVYRIQGESHIYTQTDAKYVNREFKAYKVYHEDLYGSLDYKIVYEFGDVIK
jgi:hypothetical protein